MRCATPSLIVAEDTRVARRLLAALGLPGREIWSYREANAAAVTPGILERARAELVAVTSDAGMPGISDPGSELMAAARAAGVPVEVLPGPSAATGRRAALRFSAAALYFRGLSAAHERRAARAVRRRAAPAKRRRCGTNRRDASEPASPTSARSPPTRASSSSANTPSCTSNSCSGTPAELLEELVEPIRGEIAFAIAPYRSEGSAPAASPQDAIDELLAGGRRVSEVAKLLAERGFGDRRELYARAAARKARRKSPA